MLSKEGNLEERAGVMLQPSIKRRDESFFNSLNTSLAPSSGRPIEPDNSWRGGLDFNKAYVKYMLGMDTLEYGYSMATLHVVIASKEG